MKTRFEEAEKGRHNRNGVDKRLNIKYTYQIQLIVVNMNKYKILINLEDPGI